MLHRKQKLYIYIIIVRDQWSLKHETPQEKEFLFTTRSDVLALSNFLCCGSDCLENVSQFWIPKLLDN